MIGIGDPVWRHRTRNRNRKKKSYLELFCYLFVFGVRVWRPGRFCRSSIFFFHWPAELLASSSDTTGRAFRKSKTTPDRAPMVSKHEHLRLTLSLNCRLILIWEIPFSPKISRTVRFPRAVNFRLYFLCRLALTLDAGFYTGGPLEQERVSG